MMSIIRDSSSPGTGADTVRQQDRDPGDRSRRPAPAESVQAFRQALEQQAAGQRAPARENGSHDGARTQAVLQHGEDRAALQATPARSPGESGRGSGDALPAAEAAAMWQAQHMAHQAPAIASPTPPPAANPAALAQMLERHVRQLAVTEGGALHGEGQVLLRLDESTLPGTDLMLTRTADGWLLQADVRSSESFEAIREAAGQLGERFAARGLGTLVVEPRYHS